MKYKVTLTLMILTNFAEVVSSQADVRTPSFKTMKSHKVFLRGSGSSL